MPPITAVNPELGVASIHLDELGPFFFAPLEYRMLILALANLRLNGEPKDLLQGLEILGHISQKLQLKKGVQP